MATVRLSQGTIKAIKTTSVECFGKDALVLIFGSRTDMQKKGGDIDIYIEPQEPLSDSLARKTEFQVKLKRVIGDRKIDLIVKTSQDLPIYSIAKEKGIRI